MAGLYENITDLKNEQNLTFLYRTPQYEMEPLNPTIIADRYSKIFGIDREKAMDMAIITRGYSFAYLHLVSMSGKKKDVMPVSELLELTRQKKNEFSQYRERLRDKGLIDISERGLIKFVLPRFDKFVENEMVKTISTIFERCYV